MLNRVKFDNAAAWSSIVRSGPTGMHVTDQLEHCRTKVAIQGGGRSAIDLAKLAFQLRV
jgi:hypothetical protein